MKTLTKTLTALVCAVVCTACGQQTVEKKLDAYFNALDRHFMGSIVVQQDGKLENLEVVEAKAEPKKLAAKPTKKPAASKPAAKSAPKATKKAAPKATSKKAPAKKAKK